MAPIPLHCSVNDCNYTTVAAGTMQQRIELLSIHTIAVHRVRQTEPHVCQPSPSLEKLPCRLHLRPHPYQLDQGKTRKNTRETSCTNYPVQKRSISQETSYSSSKHIVWEDGGLWAAMETNVQLKTELQKYQTEVRDMKTDLIEKEVEKNAFEIKLQDVETRCSRAQAVSRRTFKLIKDLEKHMANIVYEMDVEIKLKENDLKCPVCMEIPGPATEIYCCPRQHVTCKTCRIKVNKCPECRQPFASARIRHRFAEKGIEELQRMKRNHQLVYSKYREILSTS